MIGTGTPLKGLCAITTMNVISLEAFWLLPTIVDGLKTDLHLSAPEIGMVSAVGTAASMIAALLTKYWVRRFQWPAAARILLLGTLAINALWPTYRNYWPALLAIQFPLGFLAGSLYSLTLTMISDEERPDRLFGILMAAQVAFQVTGILSGPYILHHGGIDSLIAIFAVLNATCIPLTWLLPSRGRRPYVSMPFLAVFSLPTLLALSGCFFFLINVGAYWTYIYLIGRDIGLGDVQVARSLAAGVSAGLAGGLAASWCGNRLNRDSLITLGGFLIVLSVALLIGPTGVWKFVVSCALYNFAWNFSVAYEYSAVTNVDATGHALAIAPAFHSGGGAAGPALAALLVTPFGYASVFWLAAGGAIASVACFLASTACHRRPANHA